MTTQKQREAMKRYHRTAKFKAARSRYRASTKGRTTKARYRATPKLKEEHRNIKNVAAAIAFGDSQ